MRTQEAVYSSPTFLSYNSFVGLPLRHGGGGLKMCALAGQLPPSSSPLSIKGEHELFTDSWLSLAHG